ncbi:hypothetical protein [Micromonospora humida]|uniref:hypothetical protein n=1 Tax=Micromonospora humida TaxID=2809018 RepID=UPI0033DB9F37
MRGDPDRNWPGSPEAGDDLPEHGFRHPMPNCRCSIRPGLTTPDRRVLHGCSYVADPNGFTARILDVDLDHPPFTTPHRVHLAWNSANAAGQCGDTVTSEVTSTDPEDAVKAGSPHVRSAAWIVVSALALSACGGPARTEVDVEIRLNSCDTRKASCLALGLSEAEISLVDVDGQVIASGRSDDAGKLVLATGGAMGEARVVAVSPLIEGGRKEASLVLPHAGETTNITIMANGSSTSPP